MPEKGWTTIVIRDRLKATLKAKANDKGTTIGELIEMGQAALERQQPPGGPVLEVPTTEAGGKATTTHPVQPLTEEAQPTLMVSDILAGFDSRVATEAALLAKGLAQKELDDAVASGEVVRAIGFMDKTMIYCAANIVPEAYRKNSRLLPAFVQSKYNSTKGK